MVTLVIKVFPLTVSFVNLSFIDNGYTVRVNNQVIHHSSNNNGFNNLIFQNGVLPFFNIQRKFFN